MKNQTIVKEHYRGDVNKLGKPFVTKIVDDSGVVEVQVDVDISQTNDRRIKFNTSRRSIGLISSSSIILIKV